MRRSLIVISAVLIVLVMAWGSGGVFSSPEPQEVSQSSFPPEVWENPAESGRSFRGPFSPEFLKNATEFGRLFRGPFPPEVWENSAKLGEAWRALGQLGNPGRPLAGVYGGSYSDPWTTTMHIGLTRIADEYTAPIEAIVKQFEGVNVEFHEARFTFVELRMLSAQIQRSFTPESAFYVQDVGLVATGVDVWNNGLVVFLAEMRPEYVAAIREIVGDEVPIQFLEGELRLDKTGRHRPLLGGIQLTTDSTPSSPSTLSFQATAGGQSGFVMTGHAGPVGDRVWQPSRWWPPPLPGRSNYVGTISANPPRWRYSDAAFVPNNNIVPVVWPNRNIVGWRASYEYEAREGEPVHMEGITSCGTSGFIILRHMTFRANQLYGQVVATYVSAGGDSGAPIFQTDTNGNAIILGTHMGSVLGFAVYSPVEGIAFDLGLAGLPLRE